MRRRELGRDLGTAALVALLLLATVPAYDRVFADGSWRGGALVAGTVALVLAAALRAVGVHTAIATVLSGLALVATAPWILGLAAGPVVPGPEALGVLRSLLEVGVVQLQETPSPAEPLLGLLLLVVGGWWVVAHVAHELSVRWKRPGAGLVVVTVLWAAPLAVPMPDQPWSTALPFLAAAVFVLLVTSHDTDRATDPDDGTVGRRLSVPGLAVGTVAVVIATIAPGTLPGYGEPAWVDLDGGDSPRGYQPIVDVSQRLQQPEERDVLRVHAPQRTYLRLAGLESFDGSTWRLGPAEQGSYRPPPESLTPASQPLPPERPAATTEELNVDVEVLALENIYVPLPYQPVEVLGPERDDMVWSTEGGFLATWDTVDSDLDGEPRVGIREGVEYRVNAQRPTPSYEQLLEGEATLEDIERYTALPRPYPELGEQAREVYDEAGATTVIDQVLALQEWFIGPEGDFTYDLDVPALRGEDALTDFVLEDRVGYCEYFAAAMAVMLRETGIPARVAVGFLPGRITDGDPLDAPLDGGELTEFTVATSDAHAWVEVLFPDAGWITFEPTPRSDNTHVVPTEDDLAPTENEAERLQREAEEAEDDPDGAPPPDAAEPDETPEPDEPDPAEDEGATGGVLGSGSAPLTLALVLGIVLLLVASVAITGRRQRTYAPGRSPQRRVLDAQRDLLATAEDHGVGRAVHETTPEVLDRWQRERRIDRRGATVGTAAQAAAFGGVVDEGLAGEVERTVAQLEEMLRASVDRRDRVLAPFRRTVGRVRGAAEDALDAIRRR